MDRFEEIYSDNKWLEGKTAKRTSGKSHGNMKKPPAFQTIITDTPGPASVEEILMSVVKDQSTAKTETKHASTSAHQVVLSSLIDCKKLRHGFKMINFNRKASNLPLNCSETLFVS